MSDEAQVPPTPPSSAPPPPPSSQPPSPPAGGGGGGGPASENRQLWIVLSYLWLLALIPFLVEKEDKEAQWHAKHGLVLTGAEIVVWIVFTILNSVLACLGCVLYLVVLAAVLIFRGACIYKGLNGERLTVPGLSELADRF
jgi:uncharacterized membrane protein